MQIAWHESLKFGQLTLEKIIKIVATRCHILRLKCTKFNFCWGSLQRSPRPPSLIKGPTSKGRGRDGEGGGKGREGGGDGEEGGGKGREGARPHPFTPPPLIHISGYAPEHHHHHHGRRRHHRWFTGPLTYNEQQILQLFMGLVLDCVESPSE